MQDNIEISIVIPACNEEERLFMTLKKIISYFDSNKYTFEIVIVDDGSTDRTIDIVKEYRRNYPHMRLLCNNKNCGKGFSVRKGVLSSQGKYILFSDADLSTPIQEIDKLLLFLKNGYDVAFGSRAIIGSEIVVREAWYRDRMGKIFGFLVRHTVLPGIMDSQCGFKGFRKDVAYNLFSMQKLNGFAFDVEILLIAKKLGLAIKEVPVRWIDCPRSKVNPIIDSCKMLIELFRVCLNNWSDKYSYNTLASTNRKQLCR